MAKVAFILYFFIIDAKKIVWFKSNTHNSFSPHYIVFQIREISQLSHSPFVLIFIYFKYTRPYIVFNCMVKIHLDDQDSNTCSIWGPFSQNFLRNSPNDMDLYIGGLFSSTNSSAGSIILEKDGQMKYATDVRAHFEFVTTLCSAPTSLPLVII